MRRKPYTIEVDGQAVGAVEMNGTFETSVEPCTHTVRIRQGRKSSRLHTFDAVDGQSVAYHATGKRFVVLFLLSFIFPSLALVLVRQ